MMMTTMTVIIIIIESNFSRRNLLVDDIRLVLWRRICNMALILIDIRANCGSEPLLGRQTCICTQTETYRDCLHIKRRSSQHWNNNSKAALGEFKSYINALVNWSLVIVYV